MKKWQRVKKISEIKLNEDNTATIKYILINQDSNQEIKYDGVEKITDEFKTAFKNTSSTIGEIIEPFKNKNIKPKKITFDNKKNTVTYSFSYCPTDDLHPICTIDTPKLPLLNDEEPSPSKFYVSGLDVEILKILKNFALSYIQGDTRTKQGKCVKTDKDGNVVINFSNKDE